MATMKNVKLIPKDALEVKLSAHVFSVDLRPDGKVQITYQVHGATNSDSVVMDFQMACALLGAKWDGDR